ncbi:RraA family protein [Pirellulales bacterium]|nr:RraA family protein [Pirellulales bacterium]
MSLAHRLEKCYSGAVHDVLRARGRRDCTLPHEISPLDPSRRLAGKVFTVSGHRDDALDEHQTLLQWTRMLSQIPADSVVVCQPNDHQLAHMGELSAETMLLRGVRGFVVDGGCRDTQVILDAGFRVFCRYATPADIVGRWAPDALDQPICIGGVAIDPGDYVLGDRDGVVVVPGDMAEQVTDEAEQVLRTESLVRKAILEGVDPEEAYLNYGKF